MSNTKPFLFRAMKAGSARALGLVVVGSLLVLSVFPYAPNFASAQSDEGTDTTATTTSDQKVTLCHYDTDSGTYDQISVDENSITDGRGHSGHPMDIIPAFEGFAGLNTDASSTAILDNGCVDPNAGDGDGEGTTTGHIIVDKVTVPSGATTTFNFDATGGSYADFSLTDAAAPNDQELAAGTYSVAEASSTGWVQTSAVCSSSLGGTEDPSDINLSAGETVTCTFTNTATSTGGGGNGTSTDACRLSVGSAAGDTGVGNGNAVLAWVAGAWTTALNSVASWIWDSYQVTDPTIAQSRTFTKNFYVNTPVNDLTLKLASDNGYDVSINGTPVASNSGEFNYGSVTSLPLATSTVHQGWNTITMTVTNMAVPGSDATSNPAGGIYQLLVNGTAQTDCEGNTPPPPPQGNGTSSITIIKNVTGTTTADTFGFDASWLDQDVDFHLGDGASTTFSNMATGTFSVSEVQGTSSPYQLQNVVCTDNNASTTNTVSTSTMPNATINLGAGEHVTCTFTNAHATTSPFAQVHIYKYLAGTTTAQIPDTATTTPFPMRASWDASNIGAGTGDYVLGTNFGGASFKYAADTAAMATPVTSYTTFERTSDIDNSSNVLPAGAQCAPDMYRLVGYKSGTSLANAEAAAATTTAPAFSNFSSDEYVIVVNEDCNNPAPVATTSSLTIVKQVAGTTTADTFGFDADWLGTTSPDFTLPAGGTTTFNGLATGTYAVSEVLGTSSPYTLDVSCTGGATASSTTNGVAVTFGTPGNETCTFTNSVASAPQCPAVNTTIVSNTDTTVNENGGAAAKLVSFIHPAWTALINGASWIWGEDPIADPSATSTYTFTKTFDWNGTGTSATLDIAADNTYSVSLNGTQVGSSTDGNNFSSATQDSFDVSPLLVDGTNTLQFTVTNWGLPGATTTEENPAGLMYKLTASGTSTDCATSTPNGGGGGGGGGGSVLGSLIEHHNGGSSGSHRSGGGSNNGNNGEVLGTSTSVPNNGTYTPAGQVLGSYFPNFPNTGSGGAARQVLEVILMAAVVYLVGAASVRLFKRS